MSYQYDMGIKGVSKGAMSTRQRVAYHRQMERIRLTYQRSMRSNLRRVFTAQENAILEIPEPTMQDVYTVILTSVPAFRRIYESVYVGICDDVYPILERTDRVKAQYAQWEVKAKEDDTAYEAAIRQWIREECGEKIVEINQTTLMQVKRIFDATNNQIEFREEMAKLFDNHITPYRSNAIARTETACATNRASVETMKALDFTGSKTWMAVGDMDTRDTHMRIDGMTVDMDGTFDWTSLKGVPVRMECPLDSKYGAPPEEVINCRCDVAFEF